jgi:hypothetical protein
MQSAHLRLDVDRVGGDGCPAGYRPKRSLGPAVDAGLGAPACGRVPSRAADWVMVDVRGWRLARQRSRSGSSSWCPIRLPAGGTPRYSASGGGSGENAPASRGFTIRRAVGSLPRTQGPSEANQPLPGNAPSPAWLDAGGRQPGSGYLATAGLAAGVGWNRQADQTKGIRHGVWAGAAHRAGVQPPPLPR